MDPVIYQQKLAQSALKLREAYAKASRERKRTLHTEYKPILETGKVGKPKTEKPKTEKPKTENPKHKTGPEEYCKAVTMTGEKCKSRAKHNGLCGRHCKKF